MRYNLLMKKFLYLFFLLLFSFQTTPSYTIELKLDIPKDLKKLGDVLNNELGQKKSSNKEKNGEIEKKETSNLSTKNKNVIFFADVQNDDYFKNLDIGRLQIRDFKNLINQYGFVVKNPKGYYVEYIFNIKREDKQYREYYGDFISTNLKTEKSEKLKFKSSEEFNFYLGDENRVSYLLRLFYNGYQAIWYKSSGSNCFNDQNPQCNKKMGGLQISGFTDKKNNLKYAELVENHKKKVIAYKKKKDEEKKIKNLQREIGYYEPPIKRNAEKHKSRADYISALKQQLKRIEAEELEKQRIAEEKRQQKADEEAKKRAEKERIDNLPENRLYSAYTIYIVIKKFHEANSLYYVSSSQMNEARSQIKVIEKILVEKDSSINTDAIWERATRKIDSDYDASTMSIASSNPTNQFQAIAKLMIMGLADTYNKLSAPKKTKKDF